MCLCVCVCAGIYIYIYIYILLCIFYAASQLAAFETVCSQMLEDVQERFVYRTLIYIRQEILNYNPAQGDLAYPEKLQMMQVNRDYWWKH